MHYEELPGKTKAGEAPSCALYQTAEQEAGWMRDRTGQGMMAGNDNYRTLLVGLHFFCKIQFRVT